MEREITPPGTSILLVATMDTKGKEAAYLKSCFQQMGVPVIIMDAGIREDSPEPVDISSEQVAQSGGKTLAEVRNLDHENKALNAMISGAIKLTQPLYRTGKINGIIGLGGSMGTTLATAIMRTFPVGFPKVMISTMASRDTSAFVGTKDVMMLHSVCDLLGINRITARILHNGAAAMAGMVQHVRDDSQTDKPMVVMSTLGTTEACAQRVRQALEKDGREAVIFHTVGAGGKAMEEMIEEEKVTAVVDLSLHEMMDHRFGGDYDAGPIRGTTALKKGIPTLLVPGNIDFIVTGPMETAMKQFPGRPFHQHNAAITVVRSSRAEMQTLGSVMADICNQAPGKWTMLIPMGGFSAFDSEGGPLPDEQARVSFADSMENQLKERSNVHRLHYHINDPEFAHKIVQILSGFFRFKDT